MTTMDTETLWARYQRELCIDEGTGFMLDTSRMDIDPAWAASMEGPMGAAFDAMEALEGGSIANPDEGRMVGHYWLRDAARAPTRELTEAIEATVRRVETLAREVHTGALAPPSGGCYQTVLIVGIGGSALGPQFVSNALRTGRDPCRVAFIDNTDPDGIDRTLAELDLASTLTVVISKSGGTRETRNGMLEVARAYKRAGLVFEGSAVAVTGEGSELDRLAAASGWRARLPMWDWVGGRTSELSAVGLLPAALQGFDVRGMLDGARRMDAHTRTRDARRIRRSPARGSPADRCRACDRPPRP